MTSRRTLQLRLEPAWLDRLAAWFHEKWGVPQEAYRESMAACVAGGGPVPQWYAMLEGERILGGLGVIENDFHDRPEFAPNVCAVFVEPEVRGQGIAGALLDLACQDLADQGVETLYLVTDHVGFYERYDWQFCGTARNQGEDHDSRVYRHDGAPLRLLFTMDAKNYDPAGAWFIRPSVRGVILRDGKLAMAHARGHDFYKFPGGGMEPGEDRIETLLREVREETGLQVVRESVQPYGRVYRIERGKLDDVFEQENYYYLCRVEDRPGEQELDEFEAREAFCLEWIAPQEARARNLAMAERFANVEQDAWLVQQARREAGVLEKIMEELAMSSER